MRKMCIALVGAAAVCCGLVGVGAQRAAQDPGPVLTRHNINKRDWTLRYEMWLYGVREEQRTVHDIRETGRIVFANAHVVLPVIGSSAAHDAHTDRFRGALYVNRKRVDSEMRIIDGYQGGSSIAVWEIGDVNTTTFGVGADIYTTSYETRIDEARAGVIEWSAQPWEPVIASCLEPQLFVEPGDPAVVDLVNGWTEGHPKRAKPYTLAKFLAGRVLEHVRVNGSTVGQPTNDWLDRFAGGVRMQGVWLQEPGVTARSGAGSPMDLVNLLCSVYRAAGVPARLVIAEDHTESQKQSMTVVHAWTEFYLYDERWDRGEWIPVDIIHQKEFSSRAPKLDQRWQHFGHSEEFDFMVPFANHWVPPSAVRSPGPAAMWGWVVSPADPLVVPELELRSMETVRRGDDPEREEPRMPAGMGD